MRVRHTAPLALEGCWRIGAAYSLVKDGMDARSARRRRARVHAVTGSCKVREADTGTIRRFMCGSGGTGGTGGTGGLGGGGRRAARGYGLPVARAGACKACVTDAANSANSANAADAACMTGTGRRCGERAGEFMKRRTLRPDSIYVQPGSVIQTPVRCEHGSRVPVHGRNSRSAEFIRRTLCARRAAQADPAIQDYRIDIRHPGFTRSRPACGHDAVRPAR